MKSTDIGNRRDEGWSPTQQGVLQVQMAMELDDPEKALGLQEDQIRTIYQKYYRDEISPIRQQRASFDPKHQPGGYLGEMMNIDKEKRELGMLIDGEPEHLYPPIPEGPDFDIVSKEGSISSSAKPDADYEIMRDHYLKKGSVTQHQTHSWHISLCMILVGFVSTGFASFTVHWRRDGCLLYKLTVLEGIHVHCCTQDYYHREVENLLTAHRLGYAPQYEAPEYKDQEPQHCTNIAAWKSGDAKTAHFMAIFFTVAGLLARIAAVSAYLMGKSGKKYFPHLALACSFIGLLCIIGYVITWNGAALVAGPALWFVGVQMGVDFMAYFSTKSSTRLNSHNEKTTLMENASRGWREMPRRVKLVYFIHLIGWFAIIIILMAPWKADRVCKENSDNDFPRAFFAPSTNTCCTLWYVMYSSSTCPEGGDVVFNWARPKWVWASIITLLCYIASIIVQGFATYYGWFKPVRFPKTALASGYLRIAAIFLFGLLTSTPDTYYTGAFIASAAYEVGHVLLLHSLYMKYYTQLCSGEFDARRKDPHTKKEEEGEEHKARPIITTKPVARRVNFLGKGFIRSQNTTSAVPPPKLPPSSKGDDPAMVITAPSQFLYPSPEKRKSILTPAATTLTATVGSGRQPSVSHQVVDIDWNSNPIEAEFR